MTERGSIEWDLYDEDGNRKYLTLEERELYFAAIPKALDRDKRTFALLLYYSGCRVSEGLQVMAGRVDYAQRGGVFEPLKRRKKVFWFVPLPYYFLEKLNDAHRVKDFEKGPWKRKKDNWLPSYGSNLAYIMCVHH
jgi:hypothetical protein